MNPLAKRQFEILEYICKYRSEHKYYPTLQEIGDHFQVTKVTVYEHLNHLENKGMITRKPDCARAMTVTEKGLLAVMSSIQITCPSCGKTFNLERKSK